MTLSDCGLIENICQKFISDMSQVCQRELLRANEKRASLAAAVFDRSYLTDERPWRYSGEVRRQFSRLQCEYRRLIEQNSAVPKDLPDIQDF